MALRPRAAEHYEQAQAFDEFYSHLGGTASAWPQWVAVVLFYTAVHEVQAFLVARQVYTYDHVTRRQALDARWRPLDGLYGTLSDLSRKARYDDCITPSEAQLQIGHAALQMIRQEIAQAGGAQPPY